MPKVPVFEEKGITYWHEIRRGIGLDIETDVLCGGRTVRPLLCNTSQ